MEKRMLQLTLKSQNRLLELEAVRQSFANRIRLSSEQVSNALAAFDIAGLYNPDLCGAIISKRMEVHISLLPNCPRHAVLGRIMRRTIDDKIKRYGRATTSAMFDDMRSDRFIRRLGFKPCGHNEREQLYEIRA
jgi:hypothetical protein